MKKIHFVAIAIIIISIGILISASKDVSTYADFSIAADTGNRVKVVAQLEKNKEILFKPEIDPNKTTFYAKDEKGEYVEIGITDAQGAISIVVLLKSKPQDFEMSEQLVLTGEIQGEEFVADDILMKCPSKYKEEEIYIKSES